MKFLPPIMTPLLQPIDQLVISNLKKLYTRALFRKCFEMTYDTQLKLQRNQRSTASKTHRREEIPKGESSSLFMKGYSLSKQYPFPHLSLFHPRTPAHRNKKCMQSKKVRNKVNYYALLLFYSFVYALYINVA